MSIEDIFRGVTFPDTKIAVGGPANPTPPGQPADSPPATPGATPVSPTGNEPAKDAAKPADKPADQPAPVTDKDKPLPYDQDPKWKKARAAEAKLEALMQKHGVLDPDLLDAEIEKAKTLRSKLGDKDPDKLLEADRIAEQIRLDKARQAAEKAKAEGSPDEYIAKLEKQVEDLQNAINTDRATRKEREESQRILQEYTDTADKLITVMTEDEPVSQDERDFMKLLLGIDNPVNQVDLMDKPTLQKEMRANVEKFTKFLKTVKQNAATKAVEDYVAGKKPIVPDSSAGPAAPGAQNIQTGRKPLDPKLSVDQAFGQANDQLVELLLQSAKGL